MNLSKDECEMLQRHFGNEASQASKKASETRELLRRAIDDAREAHVSTAREYALIETYEQLSKACTSMAVHYGYLAALNDD